MKLCFICPEYPPGPHGGVGSFVQLMARALVQAGHQLRVVGIYPSSYPAPDYEADQGVRIWRLREPLAPFGWLFARLQLYRLVKSWIDQGECDLVESPDWNGSFAGWPRLPVPLVSRAHGSLTYFACELGKPVDPIGHRLEAWSYKRTDVWAAVSRHTGDLTKKLFSLQSGPDAVLYNPVFVPSSVTPLWQRDRSRVLFTGTLTPKKGILSLISAWSIVKEKNSLAVLDVYGKDEPLKNGASSMQAHLLDQIPPEFRHSVRFHGHVDRKTLLSALQSARVAVFPSYTETFGLCAVEAMACGCPTIYTKLSCGPEVVRDRVDGLLVDPDRPSEIAETILTLLSSEEMAGRLSEAGRARVLELYSLEKLLPANGEFLNEAIRSFSKRSNPKTWTSKWSNKVAL